MSEFIKDIDLIANSPASPGGFKSLDMNNEQIPNLPTPVSDGDAANKKYVDDSIGARYSHFMVWAEESAQLSTTVNGGFQWSFGDGQETGITTGVMIGVDCELVSILLSCDSVLSTGQAAVVATYRSGKDLGESVDVDVNTENNYKGIKTLETPTPFSMGQYVNFRTFGVTGTVTHGIISATFRVPI